VRPRRSGTYDLSPPLCTEYASTQTLGLESSVLPFGAPDARLRQRSPAVGVSSLERIHGAPPDSLDAGAGALDGHHLDLDEQLGARPAADAAAESWALRESGTKAALWSVALTSDGQRGWAVGAGATILATGDGGRSWTPQVSGPKAASRLADLTDSRQRGDPPPQRARILSNSPPGNALARSGVGAFRVPRVRRLAFRGLPVSPLDRGPEPSR